MAGWSHGKETPELKASLDKIRRTASEMITEIDEHLLVLQKEHGIEVTAPASALADLHTKAAQSEQAKALKPACRKPKHFRKEDSR